MPSYERFKPDGLDEDGRLGPPLKPIGIPKIIVESPECHICGCEKTFKIECQLLKTDGKSVGTGIWYGCAACGYRTSTTANFP